MSGPIHPVEEEIIRYVKNNPGCSKSDIVRFIKGKQLMGRPAVLQHIDKLEREKMIICELERPNSQIYKVYVNEDNKITSFLVELEEFKKAYDSLLEKSREKINNKDYSVVKILGFNEVDPSKWTQEDKIKYIIWESKRSRENMKEDEKMGKYHGLHLSKGYFNERKSQLDSINKRISEMANNQPRPESSKNLVLKKHKLLSDIEAEIIESNQIWNQMINSLNSVKDYEVVYLNENSIFLFYLFIKIIIFRIIFFRSNNLEQTLSTIYPVIFRIINEVQIQLSEFLRTCKIGFNDPTPLDNIAFYFGQTRELELKPYYLRQYQALGMKAEIRSLMNSLLRLNEEIKMYNILDADVIMSPVNDVDKIHALDKEIKKKSKYIKESKSITEMEINSPEYQSRDKMIMQVAEKIIQLVPA